MKENPVSVTLTAFLLFLAVLFVVHWCINFHCRKWLVMRWDSWGLNSPKNRLMITRCPDKRAQSQICSSVASVARRTVHTIRWVHQNSKNEIGLTGGFRLKSKAREFRLKSRPNDSGSTQGLPALCCYLLNISFAEWSPTVVVILHVCNVAWLNFISYNSFRFDICVFL